MKNYRLKSKKELIREINRLKESEEKSTALYFLKALINNRKELIWSLDKDLNFLIFNDFFAEIYWKTYKIELKKGMNALKILNTKLKTFWTPLYETALAGKSVNSEFSEKITDKQHYFEVSIEPMLLDNQIIGVSAISRDITERKELIESKGRYKIMLDDIPIGIAVHQDGKIAYINTKGVEIMHAEKASNLIGQSIFKFIPEKTYKHLAAQIKETLNGKKHLKPVEEKYSRYDGKVIDVEVTATPVKFNNKPAIQITVSDISERKKAETELKDYQYQLEDLVKERTIEVEDKVQKLEDSQKAMRYLLEDVNETTGRLLEVNKKLEESNRDLEAFAYSVSHDLKSPLRAIIGYTNALQEDFPKQFSGNAEEFLNLVIKNSLNMNTLIDDLLLFARAGRNELNRSKFNLSILVNDVFNSLKQNYSDKKIELQIEKDVFINADIGSMKQIIFNLLNNALKFSKKKDQIKIEFGAKFIEGQNTYFIKDNGIGFDMKYHNKLFGVFQRLHTTDKYEGTGIGLSLVKRIIDKHKGNIYAESELGKGSTFYFTVS
ncbi:MAG: PAS domain S-box protein [Chlorobi bacterium]|nr:PAS domain S-box protein [Chlorobiota bacterium]